MLIYNYLGAGLLLAAVVVGALVHGGTGSWIAAVLAGCAAAAVLDVAVRLLQPRRDDRLEWRAGGMLMFLPVWFLAVVIAATALIARFVLFAPKRPRKAELGSSVDVPSAPEEPDYEGPPRWLTEALAKPRLGVLGELGGRWGTPQELLGKPTVKVWMVATDVPSTIEIDPTLTEPIDAYGVCEVEVGMAVEAIRRDMRLPRREADREVASRAGQLVVRPDVVARLRETRPVVVIAAADCHEWYAPQLYTCNDSRCVR